MFRVRCVGMGSMSLTILVTLLIALSLAGYVLGRQRAIALAGGQISRLHSVPGYHGLYVALWATVPVLALLTLWVASRHGLVMNLVLAGLPENLTRADIQSLSLLKADILNLVHGINAGRTASPEVVAAAQSYQTLLGLFDAGLLAVGAFVCAGGLWWARGRLGATFRARNRVETGIDRALILCSMIAILTTVGIVLSLVFEAMRFFAKIPLADFLFGLQWSPQTAIRADQVGSSGTFGAVPLFIGTLLVTLIAMVVAVPVGLMSAIYMSEYASPRIRAVAKPALEILAGIPTVVYGFFAALTMAPFIRDVGGMAGFSVSSESALAAGLVMGVMIIPFVSSLSDDVINAVPQALRDGSLAMGATHSETIRLVVLPAALPGIVAAVMLAISRAIGETMIVTMAAGLTANLTFNPLESVTTVTTQIATLLVGDQEFDSPKTLSAFGLGLVLFLVTLALNMIALRVVQKYREKYD